jgi:hypothetical protein
MRTQRFDETFTITQTNANDVTRQRVAGVTRDRLSRVRIHAIACDNGAATGAAITTVNFVATPNQQSDLMGGSSRHYFATLDTQQQTRLDFEVDLRPGEDLFLDITNGTAARSTQWRIIRTLIFDDAPVPSAA